MQTIERVTDSNEVQNLRDKMNMNNPTTKEPVTQTWHEAYWANVMSMFIMGGYLFVWGIVFALVIAGGFMIVGAVLFWALGIIMMVFYPVFVFFDWVSSLFSKD